LSLPLHIVERLTQYQGDGIDCARGEPIILSHFHYDHVGNYALFPNATSYVQDTEMSFDIGRYMQHAAFQRIHARADKLGLIIPGHDPLVHERLCRVANGIVSLG
jgi:glyoxylase-like metal-dependent hydrolase (beta-lactamase superfamily II)